MQFLPYNYTLAYHNAIKGTPLARPIFWNGPISNELISVNDEYLWGNDLVIAPIMHPDSLSRKVILPPGTWFDFWSNYSIPGYSNFSMPSALTVMPIFARGGSIIPLTFPMNNTATYKGDSLLLLCFRDSSITSVERDLYMDDGLSSTNLNDEHYRLFKLSMKEDKSRSTITFSMNTVAGKGYAGEPQSRIMILKWIDVPEPSALTLDGKNIPLAKDELTFYQSKMPIAWFKQSKDAQLPQEVHIRMIGAKVESGTLVMQYGKKSKK
jgi:alpha-glucosidase (family GH31 glycosyl hydrolase)